MTDEQCIGIMAAILMASVQDGYAVGQKPGEIEAKAALTLWREVRNQFTGPQWSSEDNEPIPIGP